MITVSILPAIVSLIIILVGSSIARALSLAGAFALVRFRSIPGDSKDISTVFYAMAVGLAAGLGFVGYAAIITLIIGAVYFVLVRAGYGKRRNGYKTLKIMVPENMSFKGAFDDLFEKYADDVKVIGCDIDQYNEGVFGKENIVAVFQPHRYTRLQGLWDEFKGAFLDATRPIVPVPQ